MKKKVLNVAFPALNKSGVPNVIMSIVRNLYTDYDIDVLVFRTEVGFYKDEFEKYGNIRYINCNKKSNKFLNAIEKIIRPFRLYFGTKRIIAQYNYDVIHCHNGWDAGWILLAAKRMHVGKRIVHSHRTMDPNEKLSLYNRIYQRLMRYIINRCATDRIGCSRDAVSFLYGDDCKGHVILNGIDLEKFNPENTITKKTKDNITFTFVGRYTYQKNPEFVIKTFKEIKQYRDNISLKMIGFGELETKILELINKYKLQQYVELLPADTCIEKELAESDIFLFPSVFEGLGIALLEAQCMGLHCFTTTGVPVEADLGNCHFFELSKSPKEWAEYINTYISNNEMNKRFPTDDQLKKITMEHIANEYRKIYN